MKHIVAYGKTAHFLFVTITIHSVKHVYKTLAVFAPVCYDIKRTKRYDILNGINESTFYSQEKDTQDTKTVWRSQPPQVLLEQIDVKDMIDTLTDFNARYSTYINADKNTLYETFLLGKKKKGLWYVLRSIIKSYDQNSNVQYNYNEVINKVTNIFNNLQFNHPTVKHDEIKSCTLGKIVAYLEPLGFNITVEKLDVIISDAFRRIDAPKEDFKKVLENLKYIFDKKLFTNYHTTAFAYVKGRSFIDALKRHQKNNSRWFLKINFKNFFGNTTLDFVIGQLKLLRDFISRRRSL